MRSILFVFGFLMQGIDNFAHLGGFIGGYAAARFLDPHAAPGARNPCYPASRPNGLHCALYHPFPGAGVHSEPCVLALLSGR